MNPENAEYYLQLAREARAHVLGPDAGAWIQRLGEGYDGLLDASPHYADERSLEIVSALLRFWMSSGRAAEGREILTAALAAPHALVPSAARAEALYAAGLLAFIQGDNTASHQLNEESLQVAQGIQNGWLKH